LRKKRVGSISACLLSNIDKAQIMPDGDRSAENRKDHMSHAASQTTWIAVPTYWTFPNGQPGEERTAFDHPTPLDEEGTLVRTLDAFRGFTGDFRVLVVAAGTNPALGADIHARVAGLIRPFAKDFPLFLASPANLPSLNALLSEPILSLDSYGNIRNVQLALPYLAGATCVAGIDDDEVVEDRDYPAKAAQYLGSIREGVAVGGKAGPYFDRDGEYRIAGAEQLAACPNMFLKKNFFMNEALKRVMEPRGARELVKANVAFGGNMVMSRATIARICHDPYIPRGEDYDYVINAAMDGVLFFFQPDMGIVHLPPDSTGSQAGDKASKLVADIRRFIYMREKVRLYRELMPDGPLDERYLMPYPGVYLDPAIDLLAHGVVALNEKYPEYCSEWPPEILVTDAERTARVKAREFFDYQERWRRVLVRAGQTGAALPADGLKSFLP